jgi:hypothetical protein
VSRKLLTITVDIDDLPAAITESIVNALGNRGIYFATAAGALDGDAVRAVVRELANNISVQVLFADVTETQEAA